MNKNILFLSMVLVVLGQLVLSQELPQEDNNEVTLEDDVFEEAGLKSTTEETRLQRFNTTVPTTTRFPRFRARLTSTRSSRSRNGGSSKSRSRSNSRNRGDEPKPMSRCTCRFCQMGLCGKNKCKHCEKPAAQKSDRRLSASI